MASKDGFAPNFPPPGRKYASPVGPHNFKDHFDADILEYVCEDVRLSTLQRKLVRENNTLVAHALSCQVSDTIYFLDNRAYVFRSYEVICDAAFEVIHSSKHGDKVKSETANAIGRVGFILATYNDGDFDSFWKYYKKIWDRFRDGSKKEKDLVYFVKIFHVLLSTKPYVKEVVILPLLDDLQQTLEKTENPLIVPPLINALGHISQQHPKLFEPRFQDIVDILVGWHVDTGQSPSLKLHISTVLLSWHSFWIIDLDFSASLLRQFIEDIESFTEEIEECTSSADLSECIEKISSVLQVFNTVLSCLRTKSRQKAVSFLPTESAVWGSIILRCLTSTLNQRHDEDILLAGQQSIMMLLERKESLYNDNEAKMKEFHEISINALSKLSYKGQSLTLEFVGKMINHVEKGLQVEFVTTALKADLVHQGTVTNGKLSRSAIVNFFRSLLSSRNILVLQECYAALLGPYQKAVAKLSSSEVETTTSYYCKLLLFILECLFDLVYAKGSVLSMWALDPPVFLLLAQNGGLSSQNFAALQPMVHHALLRMLKKHCGCHHQFLASSQLLVQSNQSSMAPTTTYFQIVLKTLIGIMQLELSQASQELTREWIVEVLTTASKSHHELSQSEEFNHFLGVVLKAEYPEVIDCYLNNYSCSVFICDDIYGMVRRKLDEDKKEERIKARDLIPKLPPLALDWIKEGTKSHRLSSGEKLPRPLKQSEFKSFSDVVIGSQINSGGKIDQDLELGQLLDVLGVTFGCRCEKIEWVGDEIANFCIANKLKTPFGKAQDTLAAYEKAMRSLVGKHQDVSIQQARNFLVVFERLEKAMYNAWDGNNISAFFVANKKTCLDWLSRVQLMAAHLAFHVGEFAFAYRQSQKALKAKIDGQAQEDLVALAAVSLMNLENGPDNLTGLYAWAAENLSKKFRWIKGLICMAKKRYEEGAELIKTHIRGTKGLCHELLCREIALGYFSVCESQSYASWLEEYKKQKDHQDSEHVGFYQKSLEALCSFDQGSINKEALSTGDYEKFQPRYIEDLLVACQVQLMRSVCGRSDSFPIVESMVNSLYEDHALNASHLKRTAILSSVQNMAESKSSLETFLTYRERCHETSNLLLIKKWGDYFIRFTKQQPHLHFQLNSLNLEIAIQARKERNLNLAKKHMEQNLGTNGSDLVSYIKSINFAYPMLFLSTDRANCLRQSAKLCYALQPQDNQSKMVAVQVLSGISYIGLKRTDNLDLWSIAGRSFNTLAKWLRRNPHLMDPDVVSSTQETVSLTEILAHQPISETPSDESYLLVTDACSDGDMVIGRLLKLAVSMAPEMAKMWYEFANWCLEMGEKVLASSINGRISLTTQEETALKTATENVADETLCKDISDLLSLVHLKLHGEVEVDKTEFMRKTLSKKMHGYESALEDVLEIWQQVQKRIFYYQEMATKCYFKFIALSSIGEKKEQRVISATLRLLQLIVKHSFELQESLQEGLDETPSQCWRAIIPQLFSRLNHPVKVVRSRISDLLCRIARDFPNLVIYPAIVGSMASETVKVSKLFIDQSQDNAKEDITEEDEEEIPQIWQSAHEKIVHTMSSKIDDDRIDHVKILVSELQRISILWDELWYGTIQQYSTEVLKRVKKMEEDVQKLQKNASLSPEEKRELVKDKYYIHFKPLLYILNKIEAITKMPESPTETWFSNKYGPFIEDMMAKLRDPPDFNRPREIWGLLNQLQAKIASKLLKKGQLNLHEISPALANLRDSLIPLPGQEDNKLLTVRKFENLLTILPTKTKPKKLRIHGNDGRFYTYLFKGLEDLHLDERIMQFLSIANTLMKTKNPGFKARHYSVVPLGPRSGLIQWVEGAIPMFSLYKKWHQRRQLSLELTKKSDAARPIPQKPADQYYNKLIPLLRDHGIHNLDNRKEWPLAVMRQVLLELMEETPNDLLSLTLWLSANSSSEWHKLNGNLTRSIAVMSVIGYIIGLGDRHLDNLLLDFKRGEIIHIDYNVCFEKGAKLRIPERVPFRLTQNMVNLFGLTGVEGVFRHSCEKTLESLRSGKETLLTLLEAFIYDPLVDWTPGVELGLAGAFARNAPDADGNQMVQDKRDMQAEITFSMLSVRVAEIKGAWMENKATLVSDLNAIEDSISGWLDQTGGMQHLKESLSKLHKAISILKEAEANSSHKLYALQDRYAEHRAVEVAVAASKEKIATFIEDYEKITNLYQRVVAGLSGGQLAKWNSDLSSLGIGPKSSCSMISEFLKSAGQSQLLEQLEAAETAFRISLDKLRASLHLGLQLFGHCTTMASMYPQSYKEEHRVHLYLQWMRRLAEDFNLDSCQEIVNEFNKKIADTDPEAKRMKQHQALNLNFQLENWSQEIHFRLQAIFQLMMRQSIENSKSVIESGLAIQSEIVPFIQTHTSLVQTLCLNQLVVSAQKVSELEVNLSEDDLFVQVVSEARAGNLLDELIMEVGYVDQIVKFMENFSLVESSSLVTMVHGFSNAAKQFKLLVGNYFAIILQEGLKTCQREDGSMDSAACSIFDIQKISDVRIGEVTRGILNKDEKCIEIGRNMDDALLDLIKKYNSSGNLTPGQMIILAMNALLDNIHSAMADTYPQENDREFDLLAAKVSKIEVLTEFFTICVRAMNCFKSDQSGQLFPTGDEMGLPVTRYMAEYFSRHFKGRFSKVVNQLATEALSDKLKSMNLEDAVSLKISEARDKGQFLNLELNAVFMNLRKVEIAIHLEHKVEILNAYQQINQLQRNSFQWFHEDNLPLEAITPVPPLRSQVILDLKTCLMALTGTQKELLDIHARYLELHGTVEQRLKWACGANPDLQENFDQFSSSFTAEIEAMKAVMNISKAMSKSANSVIHHESLRTFSREAVTSDSYVMALLGECHQSAQLQEAQAANKELGALELSIFSVNPPEDLIDQKWIKVTGDLVVKKVRAIQKETDEEKEKIKSSYHNLQAKIFDFKKTLTSHQKLMADVGSLIRSIDKNDELEVQEIKIYLSNYREFTEGIGSMLKKVTTSIDELTEERAREVLTEVEGIKESLPGIYDHLISMTALLKDENIDQFKKPGTNVTSEAEVEVSSSNAEEKNAFALSVLRRIKMKLDGREPDVLRKASVAEQVDFIIREATNMDNLALLYEGWTAWI